jgi:hypothetical protein
MSERTQKQFEDARLPNPEQAREQIRLLVSEASNLLAHVSALLTAEHILSKETQSPVPTTVSTAIARIQNELRNPHYLFVETLVPDLTAEIDVVSSLTTEEKQSPLIQALNTVTSFADNIEGLIHTTTGDQKKFLETSKTLLEITQSLLNLAATAQIAKNRTSGHAQLLIDSEVLDGGMQQITEAFTENKVATVYQFLQQLFMEMGIDGPEERIAFEDTISLVETIESVRTILNELAAQAQ